MFRLLAGCICFIMLSVTIHADDEVPLLRPSLANFPHKLHQKELGGCTDCHGSGEPGPIPQFGTEWAHSTCIGCHRENKSGPVDCNGCHTQM